MDQKREVLYQKWRPKYFKDVVGQEHITNTLKNSLIKKFPNRNIGQVSGCFHNRDPNRARSDKKYHPK